MFDLAAGFHQLIMNPSDKHETAFTIAAFQRLMDKVLIGLQVIESFVYLDDVVMHASFSTEHAIKVDKLIQRLRKSNLKL